MARDQRKFAAISRWMWSATPLMGRDETGTLAFLATRRCREEPQELPFWLFRLVSAARGRHADAIDCTRSAKR